MKYYRECRINNGIKHKHNYIIPYNFLMKGVGKGLIGNYYQVNYFKVMKCNQCYSFIEIDMLDSLDPTLETIIGYNYTKITESIYCTKFVFPELEYVVKK
ncbi:MAG: hypothetical protein J5892_01340 [Bacilli bacterium]|nr:hypothetical protein [Bacilli bacterium]